MPFTTNVTCNRTCAYKLAEDTYFSLADGGMAQARPAYITYYPSIASTPLADLDRADDGSRLAAPMIYMPPGKGHKSLIRTLSQQKPCTDSYLQKTAPPKSAVCCL